MEDLTEVHENEYERHIHIFFHNLKGFNGLFIIEQLYQQQRGVKDQLTNGANVLSFVSGTLHFKDSLCFLPFPLEKFAATFHLCELKKGFFPHSFHTRANLNYRGRLPDVEYYDPESMMIRKKADFEAWYADQVIENGVFDFKTGPIEYCKSDLNY